MSVYKQKVAFMLNKEIISPKQVRFSMIKQCILAYTVQKNSFAIMIMLIFIKCSNNFKYLSCRCRPNTLHWVNKPAMFLIKASVH